MATFLIFFLVLILYEDSAQKSFQYCTYQKITFVIQTKSLSKAMEVKKETHRDEYKEGPFFQKKYISILLSQIPWRICFLGAQYSNITPTSCNNFDSANSRPHFCGDVVFTKIGFFQRERKRFKRFCLLQTTKKEGVLLKNHQNEKKLK